MTGKARAVTGFRAASGARTIAALTLLVRPDIVSELITRASGKTPPTWLARTLAIRVLAQAVIDYAWPRRRVALAGAAVDTVHACTMVSVAVWRPAYRRVALASAVEAAMAATVACLVARRLR